MAFLPVTISHRAHTHSSTHHWPWSICDSAVPQGLSTWLGFSLHGKDRSLHAVTLVTNQSQQSVVGWGYVETFFGEGLYDSKISKLCAKSLKLFSRPRGWIVCGCMRIYTKPSTSLSLCMSLYAPRGFTVCEQNNDIWLSSHTLLVASEPQRQERPWPHHFQQVRWSSLMRASLQLSWFWIHGVSVELFLELLLMLLVL